jgi:hypothetical protein
VADQRKKRKRQRKKKRRGDQKAMKDQIIMKAMKGHNSGDQFPKVD